MAASKSAERCLWLGLFHPSALSFLLPLPPLDALSGWRRKAEKPFPAMKPNQATHSLGPGPAVEIWAASSRGQRHTPRREGAAPRPVPRMPSVGSDSPHSAQQNCSDGGELTAEVTN